MRNGRAMKTWSAVAVSVVAIFLRVPEALGQSVVGGVEVTEARRPPTQRSFYGWEIIGVGEIGALLTSASLVLPDRLLSTTPSTAAFIVGVPTFLLGAPIVHWSRDDFAKGIVSLSANAVLPVLGGVTGRTIACSGEHADNCAYRGFGAGLALTAIVLPVVDALVLGWEDVPLEEPATVARSGARVPSVVMVPGPVGQGGLEVRVYGTF
jgi:hypothetical protein